MKKWLIGIIVVVAGLAWYMWRQAPTNELSMDTSTGITHPDPANAMFTVDDDSVQLKNGSSEDGIETTLSKMMAYGDVNNDSKNDTAVLLIQNSGGSGTFVYLAVYVSGNVSYKGSNAIFIGDRVAPQSLTIDKNGMINLSFLNRKTTEPMAAEPTVLTKRSFIFRNGSLEER